MVLVNAVTERKECGVEEQEEAGSEGIVSVGSNLCFQGRELQSVSWKATITALLPGAMRPGPHLSSPYPRTSLYVPPWDL